MEELAVSVIIPSIGRKSLQRAVFSALSQEPIRTEVIICLNGPGLRHTINVPRNYEDRITIIRDPKVMNANMARNAGIRKATKKYVAFLDDDDYWLPEKLRTQLAEIHNLEHDRWLITSKYFDEHLSFKVLPKRVIQENESPIDYLFVRKSIRNMRVSLPTSSWIAPLSLFIRNPFDNELRLHQDWDWLISTLDSEQIQVKTIEKPLLVYSTEIKSNTNSRTNWKHSLEWILKNRTKMSALQAGCFIINVVHSRCIRTDSIYNSFQIFFSAFKYGKPNIRSIFVSLFRIITVTFSKIIKSHLKHIKHD